MNSAGMMSWHIRYDGSLVDVGAATDGDLDMAFALIVADAKWGGHTTEAKNYIGKILENGVESGTNVLKPGNHWGGKDCTNPSYFTTAYFKLFADYTGNN